VAIGHGRKSTISPGESDVASSPYLNTVPDLPAGVGAGGPQPVQEPKQKGNHAEIAGLTDNAINHLSMKILHDF
jgi:hypothetical protein